MMNLHNYLQNIDGDHRALHSLTQIYMLAWAHKVWIEYIRNIMLCFICIVIFINFINNISFINSARLNNNCYLLPSAFTISHKLWNFAGKKYFCFLTILICDKISESCGELMGHFILPNKWITVLLFPDICTNLPWSCLASLMLTLLAVLSKLVKASI